MEQRSCRPRCAAAQIGRDRLVAMAERHRTREGEPSMRAILLSALGVIAGFVVASGVMMAAEAAHARLFYPEVAQEAAARDAEVVREFSSTLPQETPAGDR